MGGGGGLMWKPVFITGSCGRAVSGHLWTFDGGYMLPGKWMCWRAEAGDNTVISPGCVACCLTTDAIRSDRAVLDVILV